MRDETDCFVNVGTDAGAHFPIQAVQHLKKHPFITVDPNFCMASEIADLHIPGSELPVWTNRVLYRMDNVSVQFRSVIKGLPGVPSDEELFDRVYERMGELTKKNQSACNKSKPEISRKSGGELNMASGEIIYQGRIRRPDPQHRRRCRRCRDKGWADRQKARSSAKVIDAEGKTEMAGGVDVHAHVEDRKVNIGGLFRPEDKLLSGVSCSTMDRRTAYRMESGFSIPSTFKTGYDLCKDGVCVRDGAQCHPSTPHISTKRSTIPRLSMRQRSRFSGITGLSWSTLRMGEVENTAAYIAWLLKDNERFWGQVRSPGGTAAWGWGLNCLSLEIGSYLILHPGRSSPA